MYKLYQTKKELPGVTSLLQDALRVLLVRRLREGRDEVLREPLDLRACDQGADLAQDAARRAARLAITRDGKLYPGSGRPPTRPDPARKAQLQRKLDKKLGEMSDGRKAKKKADDANGRQ